jgi:serine protease Do
MRLGLIGRGALAVGLLAAAATAFAAPAGFRPGALTPAFGPLPVQSEPSAPTTTPAPAPPAEAVTPPPILPAPHMPGDNPVVTLPPENTPEKEVAAPAAPGGIPVTRSGAVFSFADLAERLLDSVVYISTSQRVAIAKHTPKPPASPDTPPGDDFFNDLFDDNGDGADSQAVQSLGSGFVIDTSGLIVTNNHVIADADEIVANFTNGEKLEATVVGIDDKTDLALLKVDSPKPLKAAVFGRSERMRVGDWVLAIGNPFGFGGTVTAGIVSALDRDINSGPYDHYIQTDASINRGNSGGPLFNIDGEVVGINTAIMSPTGGSIGIGFSVPSEIAVPVIEQLRRFGEVRRGWIGVRIQDVTDDVAEGLGMDHATGAFIAGLTADGPAAKAGIKEGDIVVEFDGKKVDTMRALPRLVADTPPGNTVDVTVMRDGKEITLKIDVGLLEDEPVKKASLTTGDQPDDSAPPPDDAAQMFGLTLGAITDEARKDFSIDSSVEGVLVTAVEPGSEAAEKSLKPGEVIVQVSQQDVSTAEEVTARIEELKSEGRRTVMLLVSGEDNKLRFVSLRLDAAQ